MITRKQLAAGLKRCGSSIQEFEAEVTRQKGYIYFGGTLEEAIVLSIRWDTTTQGWMYWDMVRRNITTAPNLLADVGDILPDYCIEKRGREMKTSSLILIIGFGLLVTLCGCRVNHKMSGEVDANTNNTVRVEVDCPICNVPEWSFEQKTECLKICLNPSVNATVDDEITDLLGDGAIEPTNTLGGI